MTRHPVQTTGLTTIERIFAVRLRDCRPIILGGYQYHAWHELVNLVAHFNVRESVRDRFIEIAERGE